MSRLPAGLSLFAAAAAAVPAAAAAWVEAGVEVAPEDGGSVSSPVAVLRPGVHLN